MAEGKNYEPGDTGWVIRSETTFNGRQMVSWWYGPDRMIPTVYGSLSYSVRVWRLRRQAVDAFKSVYGSMRPYSTDRATAQKVEDAEREQSSR